MAVSDQEPPDNPARTSFLTRMIATGFFSGYIPWASGTFGTLVGVILYLIPGLSDLLPLGALIIIFFFAGVVTSTRVADEVGHSLTRTAEATKSVFQGKDHGAPDPSIVVIDEIVGVWIALFALPFSLPAVIIAFLSFRALDILKPPPARQAESIPNGWGIMLDDVVAGIYANVITRIVLILAG